MQSPFNTRVANQATLLLGPGTDCEGTCDVDKELGASKCAPASTPTPRRPTSSPPSQPVTRAIPTPRKDRTNAPAGGAAGMGRRRNQLTINRRVTRTLPAPCNNPIDLARVPSGMASQSRNPNTAAANPPITPAAIIYSPSIDQPPSPGNT